MKVNPASLFKHFFVLVLFVVTALAYFYPVLQGKVIEQSDIIWYNGMAKEQTDFKKATDTEPYWTNSAFGGMPTYQLGANYPHDYIKKLDRTLRFLPRPADYLFLYLVGFYILLLCLKADYRLAILGALAFGFSTYLIIIIGVGHNAKAHALGYLPFLLGGIILVFRKKYILGFLLTAVAMALEISANHYQMTYYFMLLVLILGLVYLIYSFKKKEVKHFFISVGILCVAVILGIATNATGLMATKEYADWSTRGKSELTINPDGTAKEITTGLDKEYITQYSYGITESLNILVPRLFGGGSTEDLGTSSKAYEYLVNQGLSKTKALEFSSGLPLYWGEQPGVAAPAYVGAIVFFLFLLGIFLVKGKHKWWLLVGVLMSLILSWGKNFPALTNFMIDYFPFYSKFRAVSSIQVILELCMPILGVLGLVKLFSQKVDREDKLTALKIAGIVAVGILGMLFIVQGFFDFEGMNDETYRKYFGDELLTMIVKDRESVYLNDTLRSLLLILLAFGILWFSIKEKIGKNLSFVFLGVLLLFDLVGVDLRYVNEEDFVSKRRMSEPFQMTRADQQILSDSTIYRVYDPSDGGSRTSYFHHSIWGYHAAKPARMQELFDYHIYKGNWNVLNMLNVKYVLQQTEEGDTAPAINTDAHGNAWFVEKLIPVSSADESLQMLDSLDTKNRAVVNTKEFPDVMLHDYVVDSLANIELVHYQPNELVYQSSNAHSGVGVFSEMYYPHGWNSFIDGKKVPHFKVNHLLRAMRIPEGTHKIVFRFEPEVVQKGSQVALASNVLLGMLIIAGVLFTFIKGTRKQQSA